MSAVTPVLAAKGLVKRYAASSRSTMPIST